MEITTIILIGAIVFLLLLMALGLSIANFAGERVWDIYDEYSKIRTKAGMTGLDFGMAVNHAHFKDKLRVSIVEPMLSDHYTYVGVKGVSICKANAASDSVSAIAIVAHEFGHAMQDNKKEGRFRAFLFCNKLGKAIGFLMFPALIAGIVLMFFEAYTLYGYIALGGSAGLFLFSLFIKLYTVKIETEATSIGLTFLEPALTADEMKMAKRLLNAAKLSYWAEFFAILLSWTFLTKKTKYF